MPSISPPIATVAWSHHIFARTSADAMRGRLPTICGGVLNSY